MARVGAAALVLAIAAGEVAAQTESWTGGAPGGNANWNADGNWSDGSAPPAGSSRSFQFGGTNKLTTNNNLNGLTATQIEFLSGAGAFTLNGNSVSLTGSIINSSSNTQTINLPLVLSGNRTVNTGTSNVVLGGAISGTGGGLTKEGAGQLVLGGLAAVNSFTGPVVVNAGTLVLDRAADISPDVATPSGQFGTNIPNGSSIEVNGGTLLWESSHQVGNAVAVELDGGKLELNGKTEAMGVLTLSSNSTIDLGSGAAALTFANSSGAIWNGVLSIWNWTNGVDQLSFGPGGLSGSQLGKIAFYNDAGTTFLGFGQMLGDGVVIPTSGGPIVPVPEPSAVLSTLLLLGVIGWRERGWLVRRRVSVV